PIRTRVLSRAPRSRKSPSKSSPRRENDARAARRRRSRARRRLVDCRASALAVEGALVAGARASRPARLLLGLAAARRGELLARRGLAVLGDSACAARGAGRLRARRCALGA